MSPGSAGSRPSARAGSVSVPTSNANSGLTVRGRGILPALSANTANGVTSGVAWARVENGLPDVVVDATTPRTTSGTRPYQQCTFLRKHIRRAPTYSDMLSGSGARLRETTDSISRPARMPRPIGVFKLVGMVGMQHIAITVRYEPRVSHGTSLAWIAPELRDARLALIHDHLNDPMPSRTWAGPVDGRTFERFAKSWGLRRENEGGSASELDDGKDMFSYARTYDGMNWEVGGESPIISVSVQVGPGPRPGTHAPARRGGVGADRRGHCGVWRARAISAWWPAQRHRRRLACREDGAQPCRL